jgi:asparagine synthetase B (glutamine-hydrolysing)
LYLQLRTIPGFITGAGLLQAVAGILGNPLPSGMVKLIQGISANPAHTFINYSALNIDLVKDNWIKNMSPTGLSTMKQVLEYEISNYLVYNVLNVSDYASMYSATELRVPFLDANFMAYIHSHPHEKRNKWIGKLPLKQLLIKRGGRHITTRPKTGFGFPLAQWLNDGRFGIIKEELSKIDAPILEFVHRSVLLQKLKTPAKHAHELYTAAVATRFLKQNA